MDFTTQNFLMLDLPALLAATLATLSCGLLGNYLVLRRLSLMGDAISHAVLPGIILGFLIAGTRATLPVTLGAAAAGLLTAFLVETICKLGKVESGASMGVVFSILFAIGVVLLEQAAARSVDLDADCVLYGQLEDVLWLAPTSFASLLEPGVWQEAPREVTTLAAVFAMTCAFIAIFYKELKITAFDPDLATTLGINASIMHYGLMALVAIVTVASFEAVGSILVIAMLICPAATARLFTDRMASQLGLSAVICVLTAVGGYFAGAFGPFLVGWDHSVSAAGMIAVTGGALLGLALLLAPRHGVLGRCLRRLDTRIEIARQDLLGLLYRAGEDGASMSRRAAMEHLRGGAVSHGAIVSRRAFRRARRDGEIQCAKDSLRLTDAGRIEARRIVRAHRLWESYLVEQAGSRPDHVHHTATTLEHVTDARMRRDLASSEGDPAKDPHDSPIPEDPPT